MNSEFWVLNSFSMNHSIYTGSFDALEARWIEAVTELQRGDPLFEVDVLVGSNILASYLKRRLAENGRTIGNIRFHTFLDLLNRLAEASGKPHLPRLGPSILLEAILAEHTPSIFAPLSGYRGFRDALLDSFRDLRDAGYGPQELDFAIQDFAIHSGKRTQDRQPHLLGFADLYRRFRERMSFFHDVDDDFRAAIRNASAVETNNGLSRMLVYGIYDATGQQSRLLVALKNSVEMIYFIPIVDEGVSNFARPFLDLCIKELGVRPVSLQSPSPGNSLEHLAIGKFGLSKEARGGKSLVADGSVAMVSTPGESRAALEVVREIFRAVRDGTISGFHEAAVILRQPENDIPILTEMLRLHRVPHFVHAGAHFSERPLSKAVVALSSLETHSFSREAILTAMELVASSLPESSATAWDVQSWRVLTNDSRFLAGVQSWDEGVGALVEQANRDLARVEMRVSETAEEESDRKELSAEGSRRLLASARLLRDAWRLVRQAAAEWPAELSWQQWADFLNQRFNPILGGSGDWPAFSAVLDEIEILPGCEAPEFIKSGLSGKIPAATLRSALKESISVLSYPVGRFQHSGVNILSTSAARGLRFPLVIIPGLDEGRFPAKLRQDPLLPDSERVRMKSLPLKSKRFEEEKLLFDMAARSAKKRLILMTSRLDESSDRERIPSQFFLRAAEAVRGCAVSIRDLTPGLIPGFRSVSLDNPAPAKDEVAVDEGEIRLRLIASEPDSARMALDALAKFEPLLLKKPLEYDRSRWEHQLTRYDGLLTDPGLVQWMIRKTGPSAGPASASRLEEYAKCPYFFFLKRGMGLEAWEEEGPLEGMDPLERGLLVHSILESFLKNYSGEKFLAASEEELRHSLDSLASDRLAKAQPPGVPALLWEIERDSLIAMLRNWLAFEKERVRDGMSPVQMERAFGEFSPGERHPAFRLQAGKHVFSFRGKIDRIDVSRDGKRARVVDYKTGVLPETMAGSKRTPLMSGEKIQIAVYKGALLSLGGFDAVETIEGEYLHLQPKDGRIVPCSFSEEELQKASSALPGVLEALGDGIESGAFFARTSGMVRPSGHCNFCDFLPVCGKDRVQREERKANDPAVRRFLRILEPAP
jgi:ATP-dependent helicase/nuclease subunit B